MKSKLQKISTFIFRLTPARIVVSGFIALILIGAILLSLPFCSAARDATSFTDALFTAVSSVCVTGLVVVDTGTYWSVAGKIIILLLIQIGALGVMSIAAVFAMLTGRRLRLSQQLAIREAYSHFPISDVLQIFKKIMLMTVIAELAGAVCFMFVFVPRYGLLSGVGVSVFHSVSAFCNAGFDLFGAAEGQFTSLVTFNQNPWILLVTAALIIVGGLGFMVINDISTQRRLSRYSLHSKIVLLSVLILLGMGTVGYFFLETHASMEGLSLGQRILNSFFHSVTARTAGFNSVDMAQMSGGGTLLTSVLMFIGGAPGSTAGGIKVTTAFVLVQAIVSYLSGRSQVPVFQLNIPDHIIRRSLAISMIGLTFILITAGVLMTTETRTLADSLFEAFSAYGTVGLSRGITTSLDTYSKYQLMLSMLIGRVGMLTLITALMARPARNGHLYNLPDGKIMVG